MIAAIDIDWGALGQAVYVSAIAGLGVMLLATIAVASSLRAEDARGRGEGSSATALNAVTVLAVIGLVAVVAFGIHIMTLK